MAFSPITSWKIVGKKLQTVRDFIFKGLQIHSRYDCNLETKDIAPWKKSYDQPRQHIKKQNCFTNKGPSSQRYSFPSIFVWM